MYFILIRQKSDMLQMERRHVNQRVNALAQL